MKGTIVVCPRCGDAYLHTGEVTETAKAFEATHGPEGTCPVATDKLSTTQSATILRDLARWHPEVSH